MKKIFTIAFLICVIYMNHSLAQNEKECFEKVSRGIFNFNQGLDKALLGPIARGYNKLPTPVKNGTSNFTSNIGTLLSIPNQLLQGNLKGAGDAVGSFMINSTVGVLGLMDVASGLGVKDTKEDVSQTLGVYGISHGCYFVLPVLGPTTLRDSAAMLADTFVDPFATMTEKKVLNMGKIRDYVNVKAAGVVDFRGRNDKNFKSLEKNSIVVFCNKKSLFAKQKKKIKNSNETQEDD